MTRHNNGQFRTFDLYTTNICKGIAIIMMYFHHTFYGVDSWNGCEVIFTFLTQDQTIFLAQMSKVCVNIFVFLSAFGTYRSSQLEKIDSVNYPKLVKRRYLHLAKSFLLVYILTQLFSPLIGQSRVTIYGSTPVLRIVYSIIDAFGLARLMGTPTYNATWWYMSLAILLIFVLPLINRVADRIGWVLLPLSFLCLWAFSLDITSDNLPRYLLTIVTGILCAKYQLFERFRQYLQDHKALYPIFVLVLFGLIAAILYLRMFIDYRYILYCIVGVLICLFCYCFLTLIPGLRYGLAFLGKYSMNMFLVHTLIRSNGMRLHNFSYSPKYPALILLLLLADTLLLSIAIEYFKKLLAFLWSKIPKPIHQK